jgi:GT2 family glycosyltransferase
LTPQANEQQEKPAPRVTVAVVSHNRVELLRRCLASLEKAQGRETFQIVVVDNGSRDGSAELAGEFVNFQWTRLPKNFGMTKGWNLGWRAADAEYVLFLHGDTEVEPDAILKLAETLDTHEDAVAVCPLLTDAEGRPGPQLGTLPPDGEWRPAEVTGSGPVAVQYPRGAALMARVFYIKKIRQIDEKYGQFGADADLAVQIRRAGRKILLVPEARVRHDPRPAYPSIERADFLLGRAVFLGKYAGFLEGIKARIGSILGPLAGFRFAELKYTISGQKIDGTQE